MSNSLSMPVNVGKWASGSFRPTSTGVRPDSRSWTGHAIWSGRNQARRRTSRHTIDPDSRATGGTFASFFDLCDRVDRRIVTKRVLDALIKSGALDALCDHRAQLSAILDDETPAKPTRSHRTSHNKLCSISAGGVRNSRAAPNTNLGSIYSIGPRARSSRMLCQSPSRTSP